ncbi:hypothetical protein GCWU000341_02394 [Oribacterium sp. oral taxon 078 str. F0262]|nr:hypothetical protein GCWU000341_02394 [Oribacterium sp. oral taxon 078 str. F0262]
MYDNFIKKEGRDAFAPLPSFEDSPGPAETGPRSSHRARHSALQRPFPAVPVDNRLLLLCELNFMVLPVQLLVSDVITVPRMGVAAIGTGAVLLMLPPKTQNDIKHNEQYDRSHNEISHEMLLSLRSEAGVFASSA